MKKIGSALTFVLLVLGGCLSAVDRDVSLSPTFSSFLHSKVSLRQESLVIRLRNGRKGSFLQPYGAINNVVPNKDEMKPVPFRFDKVIVENVVPAGTVFQVSQIIEDRNFEDSSLGVVADVVSSSNSDIIGRKIRIDSLLSEPHPNGNPEFKASLAEPVR